MRTVPFQGSDYREFAAALQATFPDEAKLAQFVRYNLDKNLSTIAGGRNLQEIVFNLIEWAENEVGLDRLLELALKEKPNAPALLAYASSAGATAETAVPTGGDLTRKGAREAWASPSDVSEDAQMATPLRFERSAAMFWRQTALLSRSQALYIRLSKTAEELIRYNEFSQGGRLAEATWYIIRLHIADAQESLITIRQESDGILQGSHDQEFARHTEELSRAIAEAIGLRSDQGPKLRQQLDIMRKASMGIRASLKKQLEATLKSIADMGTVGERVTEASVLLLLWDEAARRQESWDKCWQALMAMRNRREIPYANWLLTRLVGVKTVMGNNVQRHATQTQEFQTLIYRWAGDAGQGSEEFVSHIETWTEAALFDRELREKAEAFLAAVYRVNESQRFSPQDIQDIKTVMREANNAAMELAAALLGVLNKSIEQILKQPQDELKHAS